MNIFAIKGTVKLGFKSLWMRKLRSALTTLGIVFGVCSVIAMLAIGEGASREAKATIARLGSTNIILETVKPPDDERTTSDTQTVNAYGLTYDDAESIRNIIPDVQVVVSVREMSAEAMHRSRRTTVKMKGTVPWYTETSPVSLIRGRFLASTDMRSELPVCVIDEQLGPRLFVFEDPLGKFIKVTGSVYKVVGIVRTGVATGYGNKLNGLAATAGSGVAGNIYIPLTTARSRFTDMSASFGGASGSTIEKVEIHKIIIKVPSLDTVLATRDAVNLLLDRKHEKHDYRIIAPLELMREAARTTRIFSIVLGSIAAISLLVGGIGIMNIMLATVSERTREIGIRRALGATKIDIIVQFIAETLLLTFLGGILGILLGSIIPYFVSKFGNMVTVVTAPSLILAFGISAVIGLTFGLYPAWHAANMNPIESLRHE